MTLWLPVLAAFCLGVAAACLLEAEWLRHARPPARQSWGKRPWLYGSLAGLCLCLAVVLWANGRTPAPASFAPFSRQRPAVDQSDIASPPLPPPQVTHLPSYTPDMDDLSPMRDSVPAPLRLRIPALKVNRPIMPVSVRDGVWDVEALGGSVGLLATTGQYPGDDLAMVFAGHMTFADDRLLAQGAFAELQYAAYGTEILVETATGTAVYQVSEIRRIPPDAVEHLYLADGHTILLLTCTDWSESERAYTSRLLVRATQIKPRIYLSFHKAKAAPH